MSDGRAGTAGADATADGGWPTTLRANHDFRRLLAAQVTHGTRLLLRALALRQALLLHVAEAAAGAAAIVATVVYVQDVWAATRRRSRSRWWPAASGRRSPRCSRRDGRSGPSARRRSPRMDARSGERAPRGRSTATTIAGRRGRWSAAGCCWPRLAAALLPGALRPPDALLLGLWALSGAGQAVIAVASFDLLAWHTSPEERGRAYAAHFALTRLFWLGTYPAVGYLARGVGVPATFTTAGVVALVATLGAVALGARRVRTVVRVTGVCMGPPGCS